MTWKILPIIFIFLVVCAPISRGDAPSYVIDGKYIKEWLVLGPFFPNDLDIDFLASAAGEAHINPKEGDTVTTAEGTILTWKRYASRPENVNLLSAVGDYENAAAYAFCILQSPAAGAAEIRVGSDDGIAVWINGLKMHRNAADRALTPDSDRFNADLNVGANRCLVKVSQGRYLWEFTMRVHPPKDAFISGTISDEAGQPIPGADVRLEQDEKILVQTRTNTTGNYQIAVYTGYGAYDVSATYGTFGDWRLALRLRQGEHRTVNFQLKEAISISGTLLMLDDATPHSAVPVEAVRTRQWDAGASTKRQGANGSIGDKPQPEVIATTLSDEFGKYELVNLLPGQYRIRCQILGGYVYYGSDGQALMIENGKPLRNIDFRIAPFKKGTWRNYMVTDGLPSNDIWAIYCDRDGAMWFGDRHSSRASRYDGSQWVTFNTDHRAVSNSVRTIHQDANGLLWFGTLAGSVARYDGKSFKSFTEADGLPGHPISAIESTPDGVLWIGTQGSGVVKYDGDQFLAVNQKDGLANDFITAINRAPDGTLWFGTGVWWTNASGQGVSCYDGKTFKNFTEEDGLAGNTILASHSDPDGMLWFATDQGVSQYDGQTFRNFTKKDGLPDDEIFALHRDPEGVMWFGTWGGGLSRYDGQTFVNFVPKYGLPSIYSIQNAPDGTLWFAANAGGVSCYDAETFLTITKEDGLVDDSVFSIYRDPGEALWFVTGWTYGGVSRYDEKKISDFLPRDGIAHDTILAMHRPQTTEGVTWFGTYDAGILKYDGKQFVRFTQKHGLKGDTTHVIHSEPDGTLWFGTAQGLSRHDGSRPSDLASTESIETKVAEGEANRGIEVFTTFTPKDGLAHKNILALLSDSKAALWIGTSDGLSRYDGEKFVNFTTRDGLPHNTISTIYEDSEGLLWFGTPDGVCQYDGQTFLDFTQEDVLVHNSVLAIYRDSDGILWFGTHGGGVSGYDGTAWTSLDKRDGLAGNEVRAIYQDPEGFIWFGTTTGGLTRYRRTQTPPSVRIDSVRADKQYTDFATIEPITTRMRVTIQSNAIDFKSLPKKRQYQYRIKEIDDNWSKSTKDAQFEWMPMQPGQYTFEVRAIDRDLNYSQPARVTLSVVPPWYKNGWIAIPSAVTLFTLLCGFIAYYFRYYAQRRESQRLARETQQLRDEMLDAQQTAHEALEAKHAELERSYEELGRALEDAENGITTIQGLAHNLKNAATSVATSCDFLMKSEAVREGQKQRIEGIRQISTQMTADFKRLLQATGQPRYRSFNLVRMMNFSLRIIQFHPVWKAAIQVEKQYGEAVNIVGDRQRIEIAFRDLIQNACEAMAENGGALKIKITTETEAIMVEIQDSGQGIPGPDLGKVFHPQYTSKSGGTGLGLWVAKQVIERMHRGRLSIRSSVGIGTTVSICLPTLLANPLEKPSMHPDQ